MIAQLAAVISAKVRSEPGLKSPLGRHRSGLPIALSL